MKWYYRRGSQEVGPLETVDLKKLVNRGELGPSDLVWHTEAHGWMRVAEARKLLIGSRAGNADTPVATAEKQATASPEPSDPAPAQPTPIESRRPAVPPLRRTPAPAEQEAADQPEQKAEVAELAAHRGDPPPSNADDRPVGPVEGEDADVTAGIVDRLRRRMEEITGEKMAAKATPAEGTVEQQTEQEGPPENDVPQTTSPLRDTVDKESPGEPETQAKAETEAKSDAQANNEEVQGETAEQTAPAQPDDTVPPVVKPPLPTKKADASSNPPVARAPEPVAEAEKPEPAAPQAANTLAEPQGKKDDPPATAKQPSPTEETDQSAPTKQVAKPVKTNRLPPRDLVADFRPPESAFDGEKKPARSGPDRLRPAKRLSTGKFRLRRNKGQKDQSEPKQSATSPRSLISKRSQRTAEDNGSEEQSSKTPEAAQSSETTRSAQTASPRSAPSAIPAQASRHDSGGASAGNTTETAGSATSARASVGAADQSSPAGSPASLSPQPLDNAGSQDPVHQSADGTGQSNTRSASQRRRKRNEATATPDKRAPHDLAKAAAEALRRERSKAKGQSANGADRETVDEKAEEPPVSQPIPIQPAGSARVRASATVDKLVQPGVAGQTNQGRANQGRANQERASHEQSSAHSSSTSTESVPNNPPPGLRRHGGAAESSAVRSLPGRQTTGRKTGAKKSRRREGTNVVPPVRQALSARNESARTRHLQGRYSLSRSYWVNLVLVTVLLAGAGAAGLWYLASNARIYPLVGLAAVLAVLILLIAPSQIRGVWRSANEHARRKNGSIIARVAQASLLLFVGFYLAAIAGLVIPAAAAAFILLQSEEDRAFRVKVNRSGTIIQVDGQIDPGLTDHIDDTIRRSPRAHTLVLNSEGGYLFEARKLRDLIEASPIRATYTRTGCRGACILPFMASEERVAEVGSALQFGGPTGASGPLALVDERLGVEADRRYLAERGVDPEEFDLTGFAGVNSSDRHQALLDADILTAVSVGNDVFRKDTVQDVSKAQVERALLTVPFFDTLNNVEPDLFAAFRDGVAAASVESVETDGLGDRTFDSASPLIEHVKVAYLQIAPDRPTDDLMAVLTALGEELRPINPGACVAIVSPTDESLGQSVASFLEVDRRAAYFQAFDQVVVMAQRDPQPAPDAVAATLIAQPVIETVADGNGAVETYLADGTSGSLSMDERCAATLDYFKALRAGSLADRATAFRQFVIR